MRNVQAYLWARSAADALVQLASHPGHGAFLGGGTCLGARADPSLDYVVDLGRVGLDGLEAGPAGLVLGACLPLERLVVGPAGREFAGGLLAAAASRTRTEPWRRQATVAGRLLEDDPVDLLRPALLVLGSRLHLLHSPGGAAETHDLEPGLARVPRSTAGAAGRREPVLVLDVQVPRPEPGWGWAQETVARAVLDAPLAGVTAGVRVQGGRIVAVRIATTALPSPARAPHAEAALVDRLLDDRAVADAQAALAHDVAPRDDARASAGYRLHAARILLGRAVRRAAAEALAGGP